MGRGFCFESRLSTFTGTALQDKGDERRFVEADVYLNNDPDVLQSRARKAMFAVNGLLLFLFAVAARRVFGDIIALAANAFLVVDPTVAAHLPVVMTDLPVALLSSTAVLLAVTAFRSWRVVDLICAALALGLALSAKHSAVITMAAAALIGIVMAMFVARNANAVVRLRRLGFVATVLIGAMLVLWSFYLFRFSESPATSEEHFNRTRLFLEILLWPAWPFLTREVVLTSYYRMSSS